jgi:hypothetical protein
MQAALSLPCLLRQLSKHLFWQPLNFFRPSVWVVVLCLFMTSCTPKIRSAFRPSATTTVTATAGVPWAANCTIAATGPVTANGVATSTVTITLIDGLGDPVVGTTPTFSSTGSNNTLAACSASDGTGASTCTMTSTTAEVKILAISSPANLTTVTTTTTFQAGAAAKLLFTSQPSATSDTDTALATQPVVSLADANNNVIAAGTDAVTLTAYSDACVTAVAGGITATTNPLNAVAGAATFAGVTILKTNAVRIGASAAGLTSACSSAFVISPGIAASIAWTTQPSAANVISANFSTQPAFTIYDANNNVKTNAVIGTPTVAVTTGTGAVVAGYTSSISNGVVTFAGVQVDTVGVGKKITASYGGFSTAESAAFLVDSELALNAAAQTEYPAGATSSTTGVITIDNLGSETATITSVALVSSPNFTIIGGGTCVATATVAGGASCTVNVSISAGSPLTINTTTYAYTPDLNGTVRLVYTKGGASKTTDVAFTMYAAPFQSGLGTAGSPYMINNEYQFRVMAGWCGSAYGGSTGEYKLATNIDLGGLTGAGATVAGKVWGTPVDFACNLDGDNFSISNLYSTKGGLFAEASGTIQNLTVNNFEVTHTAGDIGVIANTCKSTLLNYVRIQGAVRKVLVPTNATNFTGGICATSVSGRPLTSNNATVSYDILASTPVRQNFGGILGGGSGTINSATVNLSHTGNFVRASQSYGGIVGMADDMTISGAAVTLNVETNDAGLGSGTTVSGVGGLVGLHGNNAVDAPGQLSIDASYVTGTMTIADASAVAPVGGLVGNAMLNPGPATIADSYVNLTMTGQSYMGGLLGYVNGGAGQLIDIRRSGTFGSLTAASSLSSGGIIGHMVKQQLSISKVMSDMALSGTQNIGGLLGGYTNPGPTVGSAVNGFYFSGTISVAGGAHTTAGAMLGSNQSNPLVTIDQFHTSSKNIAGGLGEAIGGSDYASSSVYTLNGGSAATNATTLNTGSGVGGIENQGSFVGYTFGAGNWKMPSSLTNGYDDILSPVFDWQCTAAASHPGKAVCP